MQLNSFRLLRALILAAGLILPGIAGAAQPNAYDLIEQTTDRVMAIVVEAADYVDEDPERYYAELQSVLDEVVDFAGFSRAVMGPYASSQRYKSLDSAGKKKLRAQVEKFTEQMRTGLVRTYGKGLIAFGGSEAEVKRPEKAAADERAVSITQLIHNESGEPYVILYQMRLAKDGSWKLRNLIVESVNLGVIYRNQFQAAAEDYEGDLDSVIDNWTTPAEAEGLGE